jgi:hypothetical protein
MQTRIARCDSCKLAFRWPAWGGGSVGGWPGSLYSVGGVVCPYCGRELRRTTFKSPYVWREFSSYDRWPIGPVHSGGVEWFA